MFGKKHRPPPPEARALLTRLRARSWKGEVERDELLKKLTPFQGLDPEYVGWLAADHDAGLRQAGLVLLNRVPWEAAAESLYPFLSNHGEQARKNAMASLEVLAGPGFVHKIPGMLAHTDPAVILAAMEWLKKNPSDKALDWITPALSATSSLVRRKAFTIVEATPGKKSWNMALAALEHDDEDLRFRSVNVLAKMPDEAMIAPLLKRCHNDTARVQDAVIAALGPLLGTGNPRYNEYILPLLSDVNPKVRQLATRILGTQDPAMVADAFLRGYCNRFGPGRDRAIEGLKTLGSRYMVPFLDRDHDPDPSIAALASSIAVTLRIPEAVPHCIRFLAGEDWWLRDRAAQALAEIRDERALEPMLKLLQDPDSDIFAAAALGVWGTPKALAGLLEAFKKGTKDLQLEILDSFARINDPRVPALLEQIGKKSAEPLVADKATRLIAARAGNIPFYEVVTTITKTFAPIDFEKNSRPNLLELFRHARAIGASDMHVAAGTRPHIRTLGRLSPLPLAEVAASEIERWIEEILTPAQRKDLKEKRQIDFCYRHGELGRFRTNVFYQRKGMNAVFRLIPFEVPSLSEIGFPESLWEITSFSQGLVLVTGPAGCGKTTTLASLVDRVNQTEHSHILTIEDPIEYIHTNKESLINQREVPAHSESFAKALRQSLREDPDVILVGEMRDLETISLAITASETGHLVLGTLHTTTASSTVDRIINAFPPDQQGQIRMMIADSLKAVISQSLLPRRDGAGRIAAWEILRNTPNVAGLVRDGKTFQIPTAIQTGAGAGMMLMDMSLMKLVEEGLIEPQTAYDRALRKEPFEAMLGVTDSAAGGTAA